MKLTHRHEIGMVRREFLQVGFSGFLGMGLSSLLQGQAKAAIAPRAKSVIVVFLTGGPSHIDTFDMKPNAPDGIRGDFRPLATNVPGVSFCEHLPLISKMADRLAIVRSMSHTNLNHLNSTHWVLTGQAQPGAFFDKIASRTDYPCYGSGLDYVRPRSDGIPTSVNLPTYLMEGPLTWPGQTAGFLGPKHDPRQIKQDPNRPGFRIDDLALPEGFTVDRLQKRFNLLKTLDEGREAVESHSVQDPVSQQRKLALSLLLSGKVARAFDLNKEDPKVRDRYGRHLFGQSMLLAKRLVEAGVPVVQANMGRVQNWDSHQNVCNRLKNDLLPPLDRGLSALLDDLDASGRLDETLVIVTGEFGRSPRIGAEKGNGNFKDGHNHWSAVFSTVFAGGGVRGGQTIGASDKIGGHPASRPFTPADLGATIYKSLGVDPESEITDRLGRPTRLCSGAEISALYTGSTV